MDKNFYTWADIDDSTLDQMFRMGMDPRLLKQARPENRPYTAAGAFDTREYEAPQLVGKNITGLAIPRNKTTAGPGMGTTLTYAPDKNERYTRAHEYEHALTQQSLGRGSALNGKWDELTAKDDQYGTSRHEVVDALIKHAPHLVKNWGLDESDTKYGYFSEPMRKQQGSAPRNLLYEQLASLSALEQISNRRLVDDPYVREHILNTPAKRETYDAITGLRQTRLDARDLPSYTRQPEKKSDWIDHFLKIFQRQK